MKIKYFVFSSQNSKCGVNKKILNQVLELRQLGLDVELVMVIVGDGQNPSYNFLKTHVLDEIPMGNIFGRLRRARKIGKILYETIDSLDRGDILYCRYLTPFPLYYFHNYLKKFRTCMIVTEHQTLELDEFKLSGNKLTYFSEFFLGKLLKCQSDGIVGVTDEITHYEVKHAGNPQLPHVTIGNGFAVKSVPVRNVPNYNEKELHLLCVANVSSWHGLDRLLQGLAAYDSTPKVILHIAGDGSELPHLQKLANELGIAERVVFHGFLTGDALDDLFEQCHIAVGSLGIHRKGLTQTSELKAREYCTRGIPFVIAVSDPDFPTDFPYILHLPADESPIDIDKVLTFAKEVCADPDHPQKMRCYAEEHLDWSVKMKKLKDFLEKLVDKNSL